MINKTINYTVLIKELHIYKEINNKLQIDYKKKEHLTVIQIYRILFEFEKLMKFNFPPFICIMLFLNTSIMNIMII